MKIAVCMKQVPEDAHFDRVSNTVVREKRNQIANPSDMHALEMALELRDRAGGTVTAVTMGKPFAESMLRTAATMGADDIVLVTDDAFAGSDTYATAAVLAAVVRSLGPVDMVLCGRRAVDGETGQVGPELAVMLGYPCLTNVSGLHDIESASVIVHRLLEERVETVRTPLPCVLTCCDGLDGVTHPRLPTIASLRGAKRLAVRRLGCRDLAGIECYGAAGSPTRVVGTFIPDPPLRECVYWSDILTAVGTTAGMIACAGSAKA